MYLISSSIGLNRRLDNCSLMSKHERRKDEGGKDAQRKNEQHTSMSKQQMSRNKKTRQEDDNKSKEGFDDIATGNPSINNSTPLTSYSRENSSSDTCMYLKDQVLLVGITKKFFVISSRILYLNFSLKTSKKDAIFKNATFLIEISSYFYNY